MKTLDQISAQLQGYDPQALRADQVNAFLAALIEPIQETQNVPLMQALDRVLGQDVVSPINVPAHTNSAMDGYAFAGAALQSGQPLRLQVVGTALAGAPWPGTTAAGQCVKITTGATMPVGLDTVVPQELVQLDGSAIEIPADLLRPGDNQRLLGEDLQRGQIALARGSLLRPAALGLLASLGLAHICVQRRLRVAYFSTGDEILSLGETVRPGAVFDSNRYTVLGLLTRLGCEAIDLGVVKDQPALLAATFKQAASQADAIITSGGVSVGEADHTKTMMKTLGDVVFWKIAMRPGRPMAVGRMGRSVLFGLPGNPVAVMVTFLAFVRPALLRLMGHSALPPVLLQARSQTPMRKKPGRTEYQRGWVTHAPDGHLQVRANANQGSGVLSSMVQANGLIVLHHNQADVAPGERVDVMMLDGVA